MQPRQRLIAMVNRMGVYEARALEILEFLLATVDRETEGYVILGTMDGDIMSF